MSALASNCNELTRKFETMAAALAETPHLMRLGRLFSETVLIEVGTQQVLLTFEKGRIVELLEGPTLKTPWRFAFRASKDAMAEFWAAVPRPGYHDVFGLVKYAHGRIDGDILILVKNLRFFKEFMALGRKRAGS